MDSHWPRGLWRGSTAARLLGMWVRILLWTWTPASCECYQVEVSPSCSSLLQRSATECGVSECNRETSIMRRPRPTRAVYAMNINSKLYGALLPCPNTR